VTVVAGGRAPARPQLIRAMNEQLLLDHIRRNGKLSRAELARMSHLSKPTVSLALTNLERAGLVRTSGVRTGSPGPAALLYEVHPEAGYVLALDIGALFLRGAISDVSGRIRAKDSIETQAVDGHGRVAELIQLADRLCAQLHISIRDITQTVLGSPGVYDPRRDALGLAGSLPGWDKPVVLVELREAFGASLMLENDIDAAALAEQVHGHGRGIDNFAFVSVGTGIGMGLVLGGQLHRGAHGAAGEIGYLPLGSGHRSDARDARKRGALEASASAAGIVRAARRAGIRGVSSARQVFAAADAGDERASRVVADEAALVAKAMCSIMGVADPELIVLGGGIGQAEGFLDAVEREVRRHAPIPPELRVSALGADAVVDGCLAAGIDRAWGELTATVARAAADASGESAAGLR
jgi:predicted NBD/HSP70 family sugar kinase